MKLDHDEHIIIDNKMAQEEGIFIGFE